jgi:hypothetical protein
MTKQRSWGLTLLGWMEIVIGVGGGVFAGLAWIVLIGMMQMYGEGKGGNMEDILYLTLAMIATLSPISVLIMGIGILRLKKWAWASHIWLCPAIYVYIYVFFYLLAQRLPTSGFARIINNLPIVLWFSIPTIIIFYLTRPKVRAQFLDDKSQE